MNTANVTTEINTTKPVSLRILSLNLLEASSQIAKIFGDNVKLTLSVHGLDDGTIYQIAEYVKDTGNASQPIDINLGKDTLRIETNELPF